MAWKLIDISKHQGSITVAQWDDIKSKVDGVILRAGYGNTARQKDSRFEEYYQVCKDRGIPVGAYWYSYAYTIADAEKEAQACLECLKGKSFEYPIYYDMEDGSIAHVGRNGLTEQTIRFCTILEQAGYFVGVYANTNWFLNHLNVDVLKQKYTLWLADYRSMPNTVLPRDMHQFSSTNAFKIIGFGIGFGGHLDCNYCYRDFPTVIKRAGLNGLQKSTATEEKVDEKVTEEKLYKISITCSKGDKDRILDLCEQLELPVIVE